MCFMKPHGVVPRTRGGGGLNEPRSKLVRRGYIGDRIGAYYRAC